MLSFWPVYQTVRRHKSNTTLNSLTVETEPIYGEKKERSLLYWTSTSLSPQSKLGSVYMAVSGEEIGAGLTIDTNDLLNKPALVHVEHYERQDGQTGSRISAWKALN
jgi:hypothetical protein